MKRKAVFLRASSVDAVTNWKSCFGDIIQASVSPKLYASGTICVNATHHDLFPIVMYNFKREAQVSYMGQPAGGFGSFPCEKRALPERVPAEILVVHNKTSKFF